MAIRERIIAKIRSLPDDRLELLADFLESLETKRPALRTPAVDQTDPFASVIGICEGPSDLAKKHDKYVYGIK